MRKTVFVLAMVLAGCQLEVAGPGSPGGEASAPEQTQVARAAPGPVTPAVFRRVIARIEPVAEAQCRARTQGANCDFKIAIDDRPNQAPNAFQTLDKNGRPILVFNVPLLVDLRNQDELAFIFGHEAAHHIAGHLTQLNQNATAGAAIGGILASVLGGGAGAIEQAQQAGAVVGGRAYSKEFELEADALGTIIAARAGYDPVRGAEYFTRITDPGNRFLGTHPPNADRIETVRRTAARL